MFGIWIRNLFVILLLCKKQFDRPEALKSSQFIQVDE